MGLQFVKAGPLDYDDVIDFGNYVFCHDHGPHDFITTLPKLYKREYFMDGIHYLVREDNKIKALIGAYQVEYEYSSPDLGVTSLPGRGIGMVTVHPYHRSRGFMKELMNRAMEDMRLDNLVFSCLSGQRQRYGYFGYHPAGSVFNFKLYGNNIRHTLGKQWSTNISLKSLESGEEAMLDHIQALHYTKPIRMHRQRERLYDILLSMSSGILVATEGGRFEGYLLYHSGEDGKLQITEINLCDLSRLPEVLGLFLSKDNLVGKRESVWITALPYEREKIAALSRFSEEYTQSQAYQFAVFDYRRFIEPFLRLKAREQTLADGSFIIRIEGAVQIKLAVTQGAASVTEIADSDSGKADLCLSDREVLDFLFSPLAAQVYPVIGKNVFLQSLLPLPLFIETADTV